MTSQKTIATIRKGNDATIRISLQVYMGREVIDMRVWVGDIPTKKGVTCSATLLPELIAGLEAAQKELTDA